MNQWRCRDEFHTTLRHSTRQNALRSCEQEKGSVKKPLQQEGIGGGGWLPGRGAIRPLAVYIVKCFHSEVPAMKLKM